MSDEFDFDKVLKAELDSHLAQDLVSNSRNGKTKKMIKSLAGPFELDTPRDHAGNFAPQLIKKHQTSVNDKIEAKILPMFGLGMSYRDIATQVEDLYGIKVSTATLSAITDKIIVEISE